MASGPITSWQIDVETVETVTDFIFFGSRITADDDCNHQIKRHLLIGRKAMTNLDSMWKSRDITLLTKVRLVKAMVFLVVMYGCESWATKKTECQRIDAFELWCWRRLSRVLWTARRSVNPIGNQSWISIGRTDTEAEASILWPLDAKNRLEKTLMPGKIEGRSRRSDREWDGWRASPTWWTWVWTSSGSCYRQGGLVCCNLWGCKDLDISEWLNLATCHSIEICF